MKVWLQSLETTYSFFTCFRVHFPIFPKDKTSVKESTKRSMPILLHFISFQLVDEVWLTVRALRNIPWQVVITDFKKYHLLRRICFSAYLSIIPNEHYFFKQEFYGCFLIGTGLVCQKVKRVFFRCSMFISFSFSI